MARIRQSALVLAASLGAMVSAPTATRAEIIPAAKMAQGVSMSQAQCAAQPSAVWVVVNREGYCIRYYVSTAGGQGSTPVAFLEGDQLGSYKPQTRTFSRVGPESDVDTEELQQTANSLSKLAATTAIYIGRPGIEGSSGFHGYRRSWLELYIVHAALDAIKRRHSYAGFHLVGQSGGAGLVAGLVILRTDLVCVAPGAGPLALLGERRSTDNPMLRLFDPIKEIALIASRRGTRFIVVTDPEDQKVKLENQVAFVQALRRAGGHVQQYFVQATDSNRHGVRSYAFRAVAGCIKGETQEQITAGLMDLQKRKLAAAEAKRARTAAAGAPAQPPAAAPAPHVPGPSRAIPVRAWQQPPVFSLPTKWSRA